MEDWDCPECGYANANATIRCPCCGYAKLTRLVLTSNDGNCWKTVRPAKLASQDYRSRLYPNDYDYVPREEGRHPFAVDLNDHHEWVLVPNNGSPVDVAVNETVQLGYRVLQEGDVISLACKGGSTYVLPLKVSFLQVEDDTGVD